MELSLPDGSEQTPTYAHYGSSAQNNNTGNGTQNNNNGAGYQNNGPGQQLITNIVNNYASGFLGASSEFKASSDEAESIANQTGHFFVLYSENPAFTPRDVVSQQIDSLLARLAVDKDKQIRIAIYGLGGTGKTQIALNLAYSKKVRNVYWVNGDSIESFMARYSAIAQLAQLGTQGMKPNNICLAVKKWFEDSNDWLLCIDNADKLTDAYVESIQAYLPRSKGVIVFTTRDGSIGNKLVHPVFCLKLEAAMTKDEATTTFKSALGGESFFDDADIERILQRLDNLPLAIVQAAAYIRQNRVTIDQYIDRLEESEAKLLAVPLLEVDQAARAVMTTWKTSYDFIRSQNASAALLLDVMSCLDFQEISRTLLRSGDLAGILDDIDFDKAVGLLQSFTLVSSTPSVSSYRMHRLVSLSTRHNIKSKKKVIRIALQIVSMAFDNYTLELLRQYEALLPHVEAILRYTHDGDGIVGSKHVILRSVVVRVSRQLYHPAIKDNRTKLLVKAANYYTDAGQWSKSEQYFRECLSFHEARFSKDHLSTLDMVHSIASVYGSQGHYEEALEWYGRALAGYEKALGKDHPSTLDTINNIANVYNNQGRYEEALESYGRALAGYEKALGKDHSSTLDTVNNIASVYANQGHYEEALKWFGRALAGYEKALGKDHPWTLMTVNNMANVYNHQGRYEEALEWFGRALVGYEKVLGKGHPSTLHTINNMANVYNKQGRYEEALEWFGRALAGKEKTLGKDHQSTLHTVNNMANVYDNQDRYEEALKWFGRALAGYEKALGKDHSSTLDTVNNIANVYNNQDRYDEALESYGRALAGYEKTLGKDHPSTLRTVNNMANVYNSQGRYEEALESYRRALAGYEERYGPEHEKTIKTRQQIAGLISKHSSGRP